MATQASRDLAKSLLSGLKKNGQLLGRPKNPSGALALPAGELKRLRALPYLTQTVTSLAGCKLHITDPYWFLHSYVELCQKEIYRFDSKVFSPYILDCGANIGLSVIFFKHIFPNARVVAFEPDPVVFSALSANIVSFELHQVTIIQKAVWNSEAVVAFEPDGSVGGRIAGARSDRRQIEVSTVRLLDWLDEPVEMLKLDIEGAEYEVLLDCETKLCNVNHLFVEYHARFEEPQHLHRILALLQQAGFRYHIQDANPIGHPFIREERSTFYDLQLNVFAFRN